MNKELKVLGKQVIGDKEFIGIEGGFGEGKRTILAKDIAKIHGKKEMHINELINNNKVRFIDNKDIINLLSDENFKIVVADLELKTSNRQKFSYLLSERGYSKLLKIMDDDLAWDIYDEITDNYFTMREVINSNENLKSNLLLKIYNGGQDGVIASKQLTDLEVKEATKPLLETIKRQEPIMNFAETVIKKADNILIREMSKLLNDEGFIIGEKKLYTQLREWGFILKNSTEPSQKAMDMKMFVVDERVIDTPYGSRVVRTTKVTGKGQIFIVEKFRKEKVK